MTSPKTLLIAIFALATVGLGAFAWNQSLEIRRLKTDSAQLALERADLQAQLKEAQRAAAFSVTLADQSAPTQPAATDKSADPAETETQRRESGANRRNGPRRMEELMQNPEFAAAMTAQAKSRLDRQYAELFKRLNLSPAQLEQFKTLLADRQAARFDVMSAARAAGLDPRTNREEIAALMQQTQSEIDQSIATAIGADAYATYQSYEATAPQRAAVSQIEQRLSYSSTPLTTAQADQLVTILSTQQTSASRGAAQITDQVITQAAGVLSPPQLTALQELQATQQAGQVMSEAFRSAGGGGPPDAPPGGG